MCFGGTFDTPGPPTGVPGGGAGGATLAYIQDAGVIADITNAANWANGAYVGPVVGLGKGSVYLDDATGTRYEYDGAVLVRGGINEEL